MSCTLNYAYDEPVADPLMLCRTRSPQVMLRRQRSVEAMRRDLSLEPEPELTPTEQGWYYCNEGQQHGPILLDLLREQHASGTLPRGLTEFWRDGDDTVTSAQELLGVYHDTDEDSWSDVVTDDDEEYGVVGDESESTEGNNEDTGEIEDVDGLGLEGIGWLADAEEIYVEESISLPRIQDCLRSPESGLSLAALETLAELDPSELKLLICEAAEARRLEVHRAELEVTLAEAQAEGKTLAALLYRAKRATQPAPPPRPRVGTLEIMDDPPRDHHFLSQPKPGAKESQGMMKRAGLEWKQMSSSLPAGVTVLVYEGRMDLLRVAIEGPEDTPYEGGLFVFDIHLPATYPALPPKVFYWAYGKYINPNLYECGKVCLSLLGTWSGPGWDADTSTLLQLCVSIQGLILIEAPYCNEPGQQRDGGTEQSTEYNRMVQAGVVDNMVKMIAAPPAGLASTLERLMAREGAALLRRAAVLGNEECTASHITSLDVALKHPFGAPLTGPVENSGLPAVGGVIVEIPRWLTVADTPFTSGYVDDEMDDDY